MIKVLFLSLNKFLTMEANELREKLTEYIQVADEKKLEAIYTLLEDEIEGEYKWYEDEAFVAELDERVRRYESGEEKGYTEEEAFAIIESKLKEHPPVVHV